MTQVKVRFTSFDQYLDWSNQPENWLAGRYELVDGELVEVLPESEPNNWIARCLMFLLVESGISLRLIVPHSLELQVPILHPQDKASRYPDLAILDPVHIPLTQRRLTITLDMPPPRWVAEVLSPGRVNEARDLIRKRLQYEARGIPEYWLVNPITRSITVLQLSKGTYTEFGVFQGQAAVVSPELGSLLLTAEQVFTE